MIRFRVIAAALSLSLLPTAAFAGKDNLLLQFILHKLEKSARAAVDAKEAAVTRTGTMRITGTFTKTSQFSTPVQCSGMVSFFDQTSGRFVSKTSTKRLTFAGNKASCNVEFDYNWTTLPNVPLAVSLQVATEGSALTNPNYTSIFFQWDKEAPSPTKNGLSTFSFGENVL